MPYDGLGGDEYGQCKAMQQTQGRTKYAYAVGKVLKMGHKVKNYGKTLLMQQRCKNTKNRIIFPNKLNFLFLIQSKKETNY